MIFKSAVEESLENYNFNSLFFTNVITGLWREELLQYITIFKTLTQNLSIDQIKTLLESRKGFKNTSYLIPIIDQAIYFKDIYYSMKYFENPYKYLKNNNPAIIELVKNIIKDFYLRA